jgi:hypothetical protein
VALIPIRKTGRKTGLDPRIKSEAMLLRKYAPGAPFVSIILLNAGQSHRIEAVVRSAACPDFAVMTAVR